MHRDEPDDPSPWSTLAPTALGTLVFGTAVLPFVPELRAWRATESGTVELYAAVTLCAAGGLYLARRWISAAQQGFAATGSPKGSPIARIVRAGMATLLGLWTLIATAGLVFLTLV